MFKYEVFREMISMAPHRFGQRLNGRNYPCVQFVTRTNAEFTSWRRRFYRERRKIVPVDIECDLSPLTVAVWLMDDGAADYAGLTFQTHSFTKTETSRLAAALRRKYDLRTGVRANRGKWIVYVYAESMPRMQEIVGPHVLPEFEYKLIPRRFRTP
jgi:LAGLIDADG DNA endonuclease family